MGRSERKEKLKRFTGSPEIFLILAVVLALRREGELMAGIVPILCHEAGHLSALFICDLPLYRSSISPFGLKIVYGEELAGRRERGLILISGPLYNLAAAGLLAGWGSREAALAGLMLGLYNLLPLEGLDGGNLIRLMYPYRADQVIRGASFSVSFLTLLLFLRGLFGGQVSLYLGLVSLAMAFRAMKVKKPRDFPRLGKG